MIVYQEDNSSIRYNLKTVIYNDFNYIAHIHRDFEVLYVYSGSVVATVEGNTFTVEAGEYALILQNQIHEYSSTAGSKVAVTVFSADYVPDFAAQVSGKRYVHKAFSISNERTKIIDSVLFGDNGDRFENIACLNFIVSEFLKQIRSTGVAITDNDLLHRMLAYISEHYVEDITLTDVADALGYEEHYLSRFFHRYINKNFKRFVNEQRIYRAIGLIRSGERNMTKVAYESGFQSVRNFNRAYKSIVGKSPTEQC